LRQRADFVRLINLTARDTSSHLTLKVSIHSTSLPTYEVDYGHVTDKIP